MDYPEVRRVALLSIHPQHAQAILEGRKTVEFRKRRIDDSIRIVVLYATAPTKKVVGFFYLGAQDTGSPTEIWERHRAQGGIPRTLFRDYYSGTATAVAMVISQAVALAHPVDLRRVARGRTPPQSFAYLAAKEPLRSILNEASEGVELIHSNCSRN